MSSLGNKQIMAGNIKRYMDAAEVTSKEVCSTLKIPMPTFSDWINAKTYPRIDKIEMLANYFGITKADLVEAPTISAQKEFDVTSIGADRIDFSKYHTIPILGRISAGLPIYAEQNIEGYTLTDLNHGAEYFALRVSGDSMNAARIHDGDLIIVRRQDTVENGEIAVVMVGDEDATVKRFYATNSTVTLMPQSTNPVHQPQIYDLSRTGIKVLGKVVKVEFQV